LEHADGGGIVGGDSGGLGGLGEANGGGDGGDDGGGGEGANTITSPLLTGSDSSTPLIVTAEFTAARSATDSAICTVVVSPSTLTLTSASVRLRALREFRALRISLI